MDRKKVYYLKELTEDGLLKDAKDKWGDPVCGYGLDSEDEVWAALERKAKHTWSDKWKPDVSYVVICEYVISRPSPASL